VRQAPRNPTAFVVRATVPPGVLAPQVRATMTELDWRLAMVLAAAFAFRAQLYGVSAADPIAYGAALLTVTLAVALAV
jgi:hypothetical protein